MNKILNENNLIQFPLYVRPQIKDDQYSSVQLYIDSAKSFARITNKSVYIIDYNRMNFLYVSGNSLFLRGEDLGIVEQEGYKFYYQHVLKEDLEFLRQVNKTGFDFFRRIPGTTLTQHTISYNFRIIQKQSQEKILINHKITPLKLDSMGNIWLALCVASLAPIQEIGVAYITTLNSNAIWQFSLKNRRWKLLESVVLTKQEKAVLQLAKQGLSVSETAYKIHRSEDSVKFYRKNLFQKLKVKNISEAIVVSTQHRLL